MSGRTRGLGLDHSWRELQHTSQQGQPLQQQHYLPGGVDQQREMGLRRERGNAIVKRRPARNLQVPDFSLYVEHPRQGD